MEHVAPENVGPEQVPARVVERTPAVELGGGERSRVALLVEVEREETVDQRAGLVLREHVAALARRAPPTQETESSNPTPR